MGGSWQLFFSPRLVASRRSARNLVKSCVGRVPWFQRRPTMPASTDVTPSRHLGAGTSMRKVIASKDVALETPVSELTVEM